MPDKFEDLTTFLAVIDAGGVNAAAAELGIVKSAVSRRLSDLERRLGTSLIERGTRRFEPTAVGIEYAARARAILASLEELDASLVPNGDGGIITIRAERALITHRLVPALVSIRQRAGAPRIRLVDQSVPVADETWDILISSGTAEGEARLLFSTTSLLCASPEYMSARGASDEGGSERHRLIGIGVNASPPYDIAVPDDDTAVAAAVAGLGVARLPDFVVANLLASGSLVRLEDGRLGEPVAIVARCRADASLEARRLVDALAIAFG